MVARLVASVDKLAELSAAGRIGRITGTREIVLSDIPYIIPYRVRHDIEILGDARLSVVVEKAVNSGCVPEF